LFSETTSSCSKSSLRTANKADAVFGGLSTKLELPSNQFRGRVAQFFGKEVSHHAMNADMRHATHFFDTPIKSTSQCDPRHVSLTARPRLESLVESMPSMPGVNPARDVETDDDAFYSPGQPEWSIHLALIIFSVGVHCHPEEQDPSS
jgi:hypothetical protein